MTALVVDAVSLVCINQHYCLQEYEVWCRKNM